MRLLWRGLVFRLENLSGNRFLDSSAALGEQPRLDDGSVGIRTTPTRGLIAGTNSAGPGYWREPATKPDRGRGRGRQDHVDPYIDRCRHCRAAIRSRPGAQSRTVNGQLS